MITKPRTINVLGTDIRVEIRKDSEDERLKKADGYFDHSQNLIVLREFNTDNCTLGNLEKYQKEVLRHELIHAFMYESGHDCCSLPTESWATNEEMIDWFAIQSPKIFKVFREQELI